MRSEPEQANWGECIARLIIPRMVINMNETLLRTMAQHPEILDATPQLQFNSHGMAEMARANEDVSGPAIVHLLQRACHAGPGRRLLLSVHQGDCRRTQCGNCPGA